MVGDLLRAIVEHVRDQNSPLRRSVDVDNVNSNAIPRDHFAFLHGTNRFGTNPRILVDHCGTIRSGLKEVVFALALQCNHFRTGSFKNSALYIDIAKIEISYHDFGTICPCWTYT